MTRPAVPRPLHVVTDDRVLARGDIEGVARRVLEAVRGRGILHLRGPATPARRLYELAVALRPVARRVDTPLVSNDRVDVAMAAGLDGVQLGGRSLPVDEARALLGDDALAGVSVHGPDEARRAGDADWLVVGTLYATASHPGREPAGRSVLERVREVVDRPLFAIGGVTPDRVADVRAGGADGFAVLRGVWDAPDPGGAVEAYLAAWEAA